eukprot:7899836-Pyramimonas_sp.AAC.1
MVNTQEDPLVIPPVFSVTEFTPAPSAQEELEMALQKQQEMKDELESAGADGSPTKSDADTKGPPRKEPGKA